MYIQFYRANFRFKDIFSLRHWLRAVTRLFSQSKYHHVSHENGGYIAEAHKPVYRKLPAREALDGCNSKVYAFKVIKTVNYKKLAEAEKFLIGREYDWQGAIYSVTHKGILGKFFKRDPDDLEPFCSESEIYIARIMGLITRVKNKNFYSPQEVLEFFLDKKVIDPDIPPLLVWDDSKKGEKRLINNIYD